MNAKLNKRERKAAALLAHYATCERLAKALGVENPDGKKISVALFKLEKVAHAGATAYCNGENYEIAGHVGGKPCDGARIVFLFRDGTEGTAWEQFRETITTRAGRIFGRSHMHPLPGFFVNGDARGYALKIDNETPEGRCLIAGCKLHTDWGGYGILSPELEVSK